MRGSSDEAHIQSCRVVDTAAAIDMLAQSAFSRALPIAESRSFSYTILLLTHAAKDQHVCLFGRPYVVIGGLKFLLCFFYFSVKFLFLSQRDPLRDFGVGAFIMSTMGSRPLRD